MTFVYTLKEKTFLSLCFSFTKQKIFWVLVFSFMYLVLVDAMDRSMRSYKTKIFKTLLGFFKPKFYLNTSLGNLTTHPTIVNIVEKTLVHIKQWKLMKEFIQRKNLMPAMFARNVLDNMFLWKGMKWSILERSHTPVNIAP